MRVAPRIPETVAAIDWSGARGGSEQRRRICTAIAGAGGISAFDGRTREQTIELVESLPAPLVVGIDMSFGAPAWFARAHGCTTIHDLWTLAALDGERWLEPEPPFWRDRCEVPVEQRYRACEVRLRDAGFPAKSIFQLVGNGQVGMGSVRGMPLLARLRASGFAIWPFDPPRPPVALEIFPRLLTGPVVKSRADARARYLRERGWPPEAAVTEDAFDAAVAALVMDRHAAALTALPTVADPVVRREGRIWTPPGPSTGN